MVAPNEDPHIESLNMTLSEATKAYGSYVLVAMNIASGQTKVTDSHWRMYDVQKRDLMMRVMELEALQALIMQVTEPAAIAEATDRE